MTLARTKIVATIGPATLARGVLASIIKTGLSVARFNMSHGDSAWHRRAMRALRTEARRQKRHIGVIVDLQGPRIRVVKFKNPSTIVLDTVPHGVKKGDRMLIDDGKVEVVVVSVSGRTVAVRIRRGGVIAPHKGVNFPDSNLKLPALTAKDKRDAKFAVKARADFIVQSFVRSASDIAALRRIVGPAIMIIAKVECAAAIKNIDEIIAATDGVMVGRGDLAVEVGAAAVPVHQKMIIGKCLAAGKPVIVATQMLESMVTAATPTRAEVSDVANAVIDHADAVMLSAESATGAHPVEAVETLASVARATEKSSLDDMPLPPFLTSLPIKVILATSLSGTTGRTVSKFRPELPVLVATPSERVARQLALSWGLIPCVIPSAKTAKDLKRHAFDALKSSRLAQKGDPILYISGAIGKKGGTNQLTVEIMR